MKRSGHTYFYGSQATVFIGRLTPYVQSAIDELKNYTDAELYTENKEQLKMIIDKGVMDFRKSDVDTAVDYLLVEYKKIIDAIQTDSAIELASLDEEKRKARIELNSYDEESRYNAPERKSLRTHIHYGLEAIDLANNEQEVSAALSKAKGLIMELPKKQYKARKMFLNTSTFNFEEIARGEDPDLYTRESEFRLIQLYDNQFSGRLTYPGIDAPRPSLKLFTMDKEEVE